MLERKDLARACAFDEGRIIHLLTEMSAALPDQISAARTRAIDDGLSEQVVSPLAELLIDHVRERLASITTQRQPRRRKKSPGR